MDQLQLVPTEDLIKELFTRSTFAGVLIYAKDENKGINVLKDFNLLTTIREEDTITMLETGIVSLREKIKED